jgi:hypothetical protein
LRRTVNNPDTPEVLAVMPLPSAEERPANSPLERKNRMFGIDLAVSMMDGPELSEKRRKELALARLMAETIAVILYTGESDSDIRIDAAKDMVREFRHVYPDIAEI